MTRAWIAVVGSVFLGWLAVGSSVIARGQQPTSPPRLPVPASAPAPAESHAALVKQYCQGCHNGTVKSGGMSLADLDLAHAEQNAPLAEKVIRKLRAGLMPPAGARRPDAATLTAFRTSLEAAVDRAAARRPNPGRRVFQRLNRAEYQRSVRDLLGIDEDVTALLPPDGLSAGFDNIADAQAFSPAVMEGYIRAAGRLPPMQSAIQAPTPRRSLTTFPAPRPRCATSTARRPAPAAASRFCTTCRPTANTSSTFACRPRPTAG